MKRFAVLYAVILLIGITGEAGAEETIHVGKAIQNHFSFALLDVGIANGIFKDAGLAVEPVAFTGAPKLQQALAANSIDFGLSTGQDLGFIAKGLPAMTVAAVSNAPFDTMMVVGTQSPIKSIADLKGAHIAVSNLRGYPSWLIKELAKHEGWAPDTINLVETGSQTASIAQLKIDRVDGWGGDIGTAFQMEAAHEARALLNFGDYVPPFMNIALYATDTIVKNHPDTVRRFVKAWFDNVAWAQAHRTETVAIVQPVLNLTPAIIARVYDTLMPTETRNGKFDPKTMATMRRAVVELGILDAEPDISKLYTEAFLPKN
jgi:ABC-type nitrate/sulfonate/bicarbonate transport system substrate-binding protein